MIEEYLSEITNIKNYVDGLMIVDNDFRIVYIDQYHPGFTALDSKRAIGKTLFEIYPHKNPDNSTIVQAIRYGEPVFNHSELMYPVIGQPFHCLDNTYPIKEDGKTIGAVCVTYFPESRVSRDCLNLFSRNKEKKNESRHLFTSADILGRSPEIQRVRDQIERVSRTSSSVLIYGETGTGKEMVAQSIHSASNRQNGPFLSQNCAAIPGNLLESIFFGTAKGSYTGAEEREGLFERANGGTLFLDEINSMEMNLQAKLLRVLEDRQVTRIGGSKVYDIDVRIIAATNQNPSLCVQNEKLRADLFYRLSGVTIQLPSLQTRPGDLELLTNFFISHYNSKMNKNISALSREAGELLSRYNWPGNVRELKNAIEGAFNMCDGQLITIPDLPEYIVSAVGLNAVVTPESRKREGMNVPWTGDLKSHMESCERFVIKKAISEHHTLSAAAEYLGISRQSLNQKINRLGIDAHSISRK